MPQVLPLRDLVIPSKSLDVIAAALARAALAAGPAVMEEYARESGARSKADGSPVTAADERAEEIIRECLTRMAPTTPIVAEEAAAAGCPLDVGARFFLVDPLDGTREFLARNGEFTINVALIDARAPVAGAVYAPAIGRYGSRGSRRSLAKPALAAICPTKPCGVDCEPVPRRIDSSRSRAVRMATPRQRRSWRDCRLANAEWQALRSSFASSRKAMRTFIRASRRRWNGIPRRATRCCARREGSCSTPAANPSPTARWRRGYELQDLWRGATRVWRAKPSLTLRKPQRAIFAFRHGLERFAIKPTRFGGRLRFS